MYSYLESRYYIIYGRMEGYLCRQHGVALVVGSAGAGQCSLLTGNGICLERAVRAASSPLQWHQHRWPARARETTGQCGFDSVHGYPALCIVMVLWQYDRYTTAVIFQTNSAQWESSRTSAVVAQPVVDDISKPSRPCSNRRFPNVNC